MTWGQPLGLDELMIINPGVPKTLDSIFLGSDGVLYQLQPAARQQGGDLFLGDDGTLYQLQGYLPAQHPSLARSCCYYRPRQWG